VLLVAGSVRTGGVALGTGGVPLGEGLLPAGLEVLHDGIAVGNQPCDDGLLARPYGGKLGLERSDPQVVPSRRRRNSGGRVHALASRQAVGGAGRV
jgi:hypothetical protein